MKNEKSQKVQENNGAENSSQKNGWTREKVEKAINQDLYAAISLLNLLAENPDLIDQLTEIVWLKLEQKQKEDATVSN